MSGRREFLAGAGEMATLMRAYDWTTTPLGEPEGWPSGLRTAVRLLLNSHHPMHIFWGPDATFFYNDAFVPSAGPERHPSALGRPASESWGEIWPVIASEVAKVRNGSGHTWYEDRHVPILREGRLENAYWTYGFSPIDDDTAPHGIGGVISILTETTKRLALENSLRGLNQSLKAESDRLRDMFQQAPSFMAVLREPDHRFELTNDAYQRLIGGRDVVGLPVREALREIAGQPFFDLLDGVYTTGEPFIGRGVEIWLERTPGAASEQRFLDFIYQPIRDHAGAVVGIFVEGTDVTDVHTATEKLREREQRLRELNVSLEQQVAARVQEVVAQGKVLDASQARRRVVFDLTRQLMGIMDLDGTLLEANPAALEAIGAELTDVIGRPFWLTPWFTGSSGMSDLVKGAVWAARDGQTVRTELSLLLPNGETRIYDFGMHPVRDKDGRVIEIMPEATDITELRKAEEALRQSQKMEAIGQLTGGVAHDFNNLLTIIRSSVDFLRRPELPEARKVRYLDAVSETVDRAAKLTGQLLAFARRQSLKPETFDVGSKLRGIADMLDTVTGARVHVTVDVPDEPCFARADVSQFETALVNMAVNARDAMDGEGRLALRLACGKEIPQIRGHAASPAAFVVLSVTDTGSGIAPEQLARIFEPFFTTKEVGKGTGLGLSQVFGFAKQSGGDVDVSSVVGKGTTFTLYLPEETMAPASTAGGDVDVLGSPVGAGQRVLVVEDNIEVGRFCTQILQDLGYVTEWAANAEEALDRLGVDGGGFDVVFSDVVMPGMGGVALAETLRERLPALPVVLASGYSHVLARSNDHGFELLHKPYSAEQLARILQRVVAKPSAARVRLYAR